MSRIIGLHLECLACSKFLHIARDEVKTLLLELECLMLELVLLPLTLQPALPLSLGLSPQALLLLVLEMLLSLPLLLHPLCPRSTRV